MARTLGQAWAAGPNNFDAIRLFAAGLVLVSHSFEIAGGGREASPLVRWTGQISFGELGVLIFFSVSGFLITLSLQRTPDVRSFLEKRARRLLPALIVNVVVLAFIVGPLMTTMPFAAYLTDAATWRFLANGVLVNIQWSLPGVFENAVIPYAVNYPLWSLLFEAICYFLILALGRSGGLRPLFVGVLFVGLMAVYAMPELRAQGAWADFLYRLSLVCPSFAAGALAALCADDIRLDGRFALTAGLILVAGGVVGGIVPLFSVAGVYLVLWCGFAQAGVLAQAGRFGDFSYGLYLWGWPVQQLTEIYAPSSNGFINLAIAAPTTLTLAIISWRYIEAPSLKRRTGRLVDVGACLPIRVFASSSNK
ncbi:MAG: acyltransferase [Pseudomonadota bacterium]